jgi:cysteine protease ATG4
MWLTYRSNFPAIGETNLVTDMGWGCMLRTGQMLLAQALITHYLGRGTRFHLFVFENKQKGDR